MLVTSIGALVYQLAGFIRNKEFVLVGVGIVLMIMAIAMAVDVLSVIKKKGLRCKKCGNRDPNLKKETLIIPRKLERKIYLPDLNAQRHLTKPLKRYGKEKKYIQGIMFENWHSLRSKQEIQE